MDAPYNIVCDHCDESYADVFCQSDGCFLCAACDSIVHSNKISQRHVRVVYCACPGWALNEAKAKGRIVEKAAGQYDCNRIVQYDSRSAAVAQPGNIIGTYLHTSAYGSAPAGQLGGSTTGSPSTGVAPDGTESQALSTRSGPSLSSPGRNCQADIDTNLPLEGAWDNLQDGFDLHPDIDISDLYFCPQEEPMLMQEVTNIHGEDGSRLASMLKEFRLQGSMEVPPQQQPQKWAYSNSYEAESSPLNVNVEDNNKLGCTFQNLDHLHLHQEQQLQQQQQQRQQQQQQQLLLEQQQQQQLHQQHLQQQQQRSMHGQPAHGMGGGLLSAALSGYPTPSSFSGDRSDHLPPSNLERQHQQQLPANSTHSYQCEGGSHTNMQQIPTPNFLQQNLNHIESNCPPVQPDQNVSALGHQHSQPYHMAAGSHMSNSFRHEIIDALGKGFVHSAPSDLCLLSATLGQNGYGSSLPHSGAFGNLAMPVTSMHGLGDPTSQDLYQHSQVSGRSSQNGSAHGGSTYHSQLQQQQKQLQELELQQHQEQQLKLLQDYQLQQQQLLVKEQQRQKDQMGMVCRVDSVHDMQHPSSSSQRSFLCGQSLPLQNNLLQLPRSQSVHQMGHDMSVLGTRGDDVPMLPAKVNQSVRGGNSFLSLQLGEKGPGGSLQGLVLSNDHRPLKNAFREQELLNKTSFSSPMLHEQQKEEPGVQGGSRLGVLYPNIGASGPTTLRGATTQPSFPPTAISNSQNFVLDLSRPSSRALGLGHESSERLSSAYSLDSVDGLRVTLGGSVHGGSIGLNRVYEAQLVTRIELPDGSFKELGAERAVQLYRYKQKRMQRLKAYAEGQKKIRYECRKVLADARPRVRGRFIKVDGSEDHSSPSASAAPSDMKGMMDIDSGTGNASLRPGEIQQVRMEREVTNGELKRTGSLKLGYYSLLNRPEVLNGSLLRMPSQARMQPSQDCSIMGDAPGPRPTSPYQGSETITDGDLAALGIKLGFESESKSLNAYSPNSTVVSGVQQPIVIDSHQIIHQSPEEELSKAGGLLDAIIADMFNPGQL